jgi:hypothetical protein
MALEQQHGFPADDELTDAARLRIELETIYLDDRVRRRRAPVPMRLIANLAEFLRQFASKARP